MRKLAWLFCGLSLYCSAQGYIPAGGSGGGTGGVTGATGPGYTATSATSLSVSAASKTLTTQTHLAYVVGSCMTLVSNSTPTAFMIGPITAYNPSTGVLQFTATAASANTCSGLGSGGPLTDWNLSVSGLIGATGSAGSAGAPGAAGQTGPTGSVGALTQVSTNTVVSCANLNGNANFQATSTLAFTLPAGCTAPAWSSFMANSTAVPTFDLTTNTVTVNGSSTFNPILTGSGTTGYPRVVLSIDPSNSSNYISSFGGPGGGGTPGGSSGQIQYNNSSAFGGFTASGDLTIVPSTGVVTLATVNANTGACGDSTHVCQVTLDAKGRATAASAVALTGGGFIPLCESTGPGTLVTGGTPGTETNSAICNIPSGTLGANSLIVGWINWGYVGTASTKTNVVRLSTTSASVSGSDLVIGTTSSVTGTVIGSLAQPSFFMNNSTSSEETSGAYLTGASNAGTTVTKSINSTTTNMFINMNCSIANAADSCQVRHYSFVIYP